MSGSCSGIISAGHHSPVVQSHRRGDGDAHRRHLPSPPLTPRLLNGLHFFYPVCSRLMTHDAKQIRGGGGPRIDNVLWARPRSTVASQPTPPPHRGCARANARTPPPPQTRSGHGRNNGTSEGQGSVAFRCTQQRASARLRGGGSAAWRIGTRSRRWASMRTAAWERGVVNAASCCRELLWRATCPGRGASPS